jgi:hypothetical protein
VGKAESLASEWSQLSDYSGPDPAESAYKVRKEKKGLMIFLHLVYGTLFKCEKARTDTSRNVPTPTDQ